MRGSQCARAFFWTSLMNLGFAKSFWQGREGTTEWIVVINPFDMKPKTLLKFTKLNWSEGSYNVSIQQHSRITHKGSVSPLHSGIWSSETQTSAKAGYNTAMHGLDHVARECLICHGMTWIPCELFPPATSFWHGRGDTAVILTNRIFILYTVVTYSFWYDL